MKDVRKITKDRSQGSKDMSKKSAQEMKQVIMQEVSRQHSAYMESRGLY